MSKTLPKWLFFSLIGLVIIGIVIAFYLYAPISNIKNLNHLALLKCSHQLSSQKQVLCQFNESTGNIDVIPIKVNAIGFPTNKPINKDNNLIAETLDTQSTPTQIPGLLKINLYQVNDLKNIKPNNVLILNVNLPQLVKQATLFSVEEGTEAYSPILKPQEPVSLCFAVEPAQEEGPTGEFLILPKNIIASQFSNVFCTKKMALNEFPVITFIDKLAKPVSSAPNYFGFKLFLPPEDKYNIVIAAQYFNDNANSFRPFYRYRLPLITNLFPKSF